MPIGFTLWLAVLLTEYMRLKGFWYRFVLCLVVNSAMLFFT